MGDGLLRGVLHRAIGLVLAAVLSLVGAGGPQLPRRSPPAASAPEPAPSSSASPSPAPSGTTTARPAPRPTGPLLEGRDISWPNCPRGLGIPSRRTLGKPLPPAGTGFVVIGLTNGPGFYPNPCLGDQVAHAEALHLPTAAYAVVTYPMGDELERYADAGPRDPRDRLGRLFNIGWAQGAGNVASLLGTGLESPIVWVDVEPVRPPAPWSADVRANRAVVEGALAAYRRAGLRVGVYSTPYLWRSVVGDVRYGLPEWRPAGQRTREAALGLCTRGAFQGGDAVLVQWATPDVDLDALCPGRPGRDVLRDYFTRP
jgi:hypothetical protein